MWVAASPADFAFTDHLALLPRLATATARRRVAAARETRTRRDKMRAVVVGAGLAIIVGLAATQAPTSAETKPVGNLIQVMRGSVFRDANLIFDVQQVDPGAPAKPHVTGPGTTTTSNFSN